MAVRALTAAATGPALLLSLPSPAAPNPLKPHHCPGGLKCRHGGQCAAGPKWPAGGLAADHPVPTSDLPWLGGPGEIGGEHCSACNAGWGGVDCSLKFEVCDPSDPGAPTCFNGGSCRRAGSVETGVYEYMCDCTTAGRHDPSKDIVSYSGRFCQHVEDERCDENMFCTNGGYCQHAFDYETKSSYYTCHCPSHRSGTHCEYLAEDDFADCRLDCARGTCAKGFKSYPDLVGSGPFPAALARDIISSTGEHCVCPPGWTGLQCEIEVKRCGPSSYCYNGSECGTDGAQCDCNAANTEGASFAGLRCEHESTSHCTPGRDQDKKDSFCTNHGKCITDPARRHEGCECDEGWTGDQCEIEAGAVDDELDCDLDCANGGSCRFGVKGYKDSYDALGLPVHAAKSEDGMYCSCPDGFTGLKCEVDVSHCEGPDADEHFCLNGVPCDPDHPEAGVRKFECQCSHAKEEVGTMLEGRFCEYSVTEFCSGDRARHSHSFCTNGGVCKRLNDHSDTSHGGCCCPSGYEGEFCQFPSGTLRLDGADVTWSTLDDCPRTHPVGHAKGNIVKGDLQLVRPADDSGGNEWQHVYVNPDAAPEYYDYEKLHDESLKANESGAKKGGAAAGSVLAVAALAAAALVVVQRRKARSTGPIHDENWWDAPSHEAEWWKGGADLSPDERAGNIAPAGLSRQWSYPEGHALSDAAGDGGGGARWEYSDEAGDLHDIVI